MGRGTPTNFSTLNSDIYFPTISCENSLLDKTTFFIRDVAANNTKINDCIFNMPYKDVPSISWAFDSSVTFTNGSTWRPSSFYAYFNGCNISSSENLISFNSTREGGIPDIGSEISISDCMIFMKGSNYPLLDIAQTVHVHLTNNRIFGTANDIVSVKTPDIPLLRNSRFPKSSEIMSNIISLKNGCLLSGCFSTDTLRILNNLLLSMNILTGYIKGDISKLYFTNNHTVSDDSILFNMARNINIIFDHNSFSSSKAVFIYAYSDSLTIKNTLFGTSPYSITYPNAKYFSASYCQFPTMPTFPMLNCVFGDPKTTVTGYGIQLSDSSICKKAGEGGTDIGAPYPMFQ